MTQAGIFRHIYLVFLITFSCSQLMAQTTFDENGKLINFKTEANKLKDIINADYTVKDKAVKQEARNLIIQKIDEALKIYQSNSYKHSVHILYERLWPAQSAAIIAQLNKLKAALKTPTPTTLAAISGDLKASVEKNLLDASDKIFYTTDFVPANPVKLNFWKRDPFNTFVVDYYNATIAQAPADITLDIKITETNYLKLLVEQLSLLLKKGRALDHFDETFYREIINMHLAVESTDLTLAAIKKRFDSPWFKNWFWFRGGEISLNPLDFTTAEFLANNPAYDITKANIFNDYIDTLINRQIKYDTTGRVNEFIQKLKLKGTGQDIFNFRQQNDSLKSMNESRRAALLTTEQLLNKVVIPPRGAFYNFSAINDQKFDLDEESLKEPIHTGESKSIVLHNILTPATASLIETDKAFNDKSAFQEGFDTVVTQLGQLAAVIGKFSPYAPILDFFLPKKNFGNPTIAYDRTAIGEVRVGAVRDTGNILDLGLIRIRYYRTSDQFLYSILRVTLEEKQLLEDDVFKAIYPAGDNKKLVSIRFAEIPQLREQLNRYLAAITAKKIQLLQGDSTFTMQLIQIYNQSTLPELEPLKPATNKIPVYYSKILETKHSEDAIERTVEIYTLKNKDTSRLNKFTYKVGKNYRFKLGAGIAYTLNSYDQTQLKESNGQISVVNNVQQYRFVAGIHYYFGKGLFMQNSQLIKWRERNSLFIGVGIPDPLGNLYFALSHDLVPGLKISAGVHVAKNNKYFVQNNVILEESLRYKAAGPFIAIMIDPVGLVNLLNVFKKQ